METVSTPEEVQREPNFDVRHFVPRAFMMDPEIHTILEGTELRTGMVVILEDSIFREDPQRVSEMDPQEAYYDYQFERLLKNNRWCKIVRFLSGDRNHRGLVHFIAEFDDDVQMSKTYADTYTWIVKKDSING